MAGVVLRGDPAGPPGGDFSMLPRYADQLNSGGGDGDCFAGPAENMSSEDGAHP
jgi:hypothetical protein